MPVNFVKYELLQDWWSVILRMDPLEINQLASILQGLGSIARELDLPALPETSSTLQPPTPGFINDKPAFKKLNLNAIQYLHYCTFKKSEPAILEAWAESILRFMEINLYRIRDRVASQFGASSKRETLLWLAVFIMDYYEFSRDLRYLNLALKLMNIPGMISATRISKYLNGNRLVDDSTLLSVRLFMLQKAALNRLGERSGN